MAPALQAAVGALTVEDGATVEMCQDTKLTLSQNSTVDGTIAFKFCVVQAPAGGDCGPAQIEIADGLTISGTGLIVGHENSTPCGVGSNPGKITGVTGLQIPPMLTLLSTDPVGDPLVVLGHIEISVGLLNQANVGVDAAADILSLTALTKIGKKDGVWFCDDGRLEVHAVVSDSSSTEYAKWDMTNSSNALILIDAECTGLKGPVTITQGTLDVNQDFCTKGTITFQSVGGSVPKIDVADLTYAKFAGFCPP